MGQNNYDNKLIGRWEVGINDVWHKIINYYPASQSLLNNSYKSKIKVGKEESSSQNFFALRKRLGFNSIKLYSWNSNETNLIEDNMEDRELTDITVLDWYRYLFVVTKKKDKMRIYKQIWVKPESCGNISDANVDTWMFVNIVKYQYEYDWTTKTKDHFPFSKCVYDKFVVCDRVKWSAVWEWDCALRTEVIWNELVHSMKTVDDSNINASAWDYVFIYDWTYAWQVSDIVMNNWQSVIIAWWWTGLYDVWKPEITTTFGQDVEQSQSNTIVVWRTQQIESDHKYKIFKSYWPIINFATADGIFHLHHDEGKPSSIVLTYNKYTYWITDSLSVPPMKTVTGFCHFDSNIVFLEKGKGMITAGLYGYNKFMFTSLNSKELWADYTHALEFQWYVLLLWPSHTAIFNMIYREGWVIDFAFYCLSNKKWYFSKDSFDIDDWSLLIFTNTKKLYSLSIEHSWNITSEQDLSVGYSFVPQRWYQYHEFVGELMNLDRNRDDLSLSFEDGELKIFISPKYRDWKCAGTKIIMSDLQMQFWYQWIINWLKVVWKKENVWFGEYLYSLYWDKDNWKDYNTLAWMYFGEQTLFSPMKADYIRMAIWSDSYITNGNSIWNIEVGTEDWMQNLVYDELWTTSYVQSIMKSKDHDDWDLMFDLPIDIEVMWWNGVWVSNNMWATVENEITEFLGYWPSWTWDSNLPESVKVNKYWIIEAPVWMICSSIYSEIITKGSDSIELLWMFVSSDYIEWFASKPDNTVIIKDRTFAWPSGKMLTTWFPAWKN